MTSIHSQVVAAIDANPALPHSLLARKIASDVGEDGLIRLATERIERMIVSIRRRRIRELEFDHSAAGEGGGRGDPAKWATIDALLEEFRTQVVNKWPDPDGGPWLIRTHWAVVNGRATIVGLDVRSFEGDEDGDRRPVGSEGLAEVTQAVLRGVPIREVRESARMLLTELSGTGSLISRAWVGPGAAVEESWHRAAAEALRDERDRELAEQMAADWCRDNPAAVTATTGVAS